MKEVWQPGQRQWPATAGEAEGFREARRAARSAESETERVAHFEMQERWNEV